MCHIFTIWALWIVPLIKEIMYTQGFYSGFFNQNVTSVWMTLSCFKGFWLDDCGMKYLGLKCLKLTVHWSSSQREIICLIHNISHHLKYEIWTFKRCLVSVNHIIVPLITQNGFHVMVWMVYSNDESREKAVVLGLFFFSAADKNQGSLQRNV